MAISFTPTKIARFVGALYGVALNSATYNAALQEIYARGFDAVANEVFAADFGTKTTTQVAQTVANNLGLTGAANTDAVAYLEGQLNGAAANARGAVISNVLSLFATLTTDTVYGAAATAFEGRVANAEAYSLAASSVQHGAFADLSSGVVLNLTTGFDSLVGTSGDDTFYAYERSGNTLNSGDVLDGKGGTDILYADIVNGGNALAPRTAGIEHAIFRVQHTNNDSGDGNIGNSSEAIIDAERMNGVTYWENSGSRADLVIEDVRITDSQKTKDITIAMVDTDPGNVDFAVYFDQNSLRNVSSSNSSINVFVMDVASVQAGTAALKDLTFVGYSFYANGALVELRDASIDASQTYADLKAAFELALKTAKVDGVTQDLSTTVTVTLSSPTNFTTAAAAGTPSSTVASNFLNQTGQILTLTADSSVAISNTATGKPDAGWLTSGTAPSTGAIVQTFNSGSTSSTDLVTSTIILDNVGRGSMGGDLLIGGLSVGETSTSRGVERFEIEVRDSSKLQTINSTNNALREVTIKNGATSLTDTTVSAYNRANFVTNEGDLTVNGNAKTSLGVDQGVTADNQTMDGANEGATATHQGANAAGFTDVRLIDASEFKGKLAFTAAITADSITKYINAVDTQANPADDVAGSGNVNYDKLGANFIYTGGNDNDTMNVTVDGGVAGSRSTIVSGKSDFTFEFNGGEGNDAITVALRDSTVVGQTQAWYNNQNLNDNITINGGAGNDTIRTPGAGDINIDAGAGNDLVYTDNTGAQAAGGLSVDVVNKGVWLFNTAAQTALVADAAAFRDLDDLRSDANDSYNLYKATLQVTFKGLPSATITLANTSTYKTTDLEINQAIKNAINTDATLSNLLIARDGPANSLIVESKIDGVMTTGDLVVTITAPTSPTADLSTSELAAVNTAWGTAYATSAAALAAEATVVTALNTKADYVDVLATDGTAIERTGAASTTSSDNFITPGTGNDLIVLGTTVGATVGNSSNEVIKYTAADFGNDVIVNFAVSGMGQDFLDFTSLGVKSTGAISNLVTGAALTSGLSLATDGSVWVEDLITTDGTATDNDSAADVKELFTDGTPAATRKGIYVAVSSHNVGTVYQIVDGTSATDLTVTQLGSIDLASTNWNTLTTINSFVAPTAYAYGPTAATGTVLTATNGSGPQTLTGTAFDDILDGSAAQTAGDTLTINGNAGNDTIAGGGLADIINGGAGNDTINPGEDADTVIGGAGNDSINLTDVDNAADIVVIDSALAADADTITGFASGEDAVNFSIAGIGLNAADYAAGAVTVVTAAVAAGLGAAAWNNHIVVDTAAAIAGLTIGAGSATGGVLAIASDTGAISYDADGAFGAGAVVIGTLPAAAYIAGDLAIIA